MKTAEIQQAITEAAAKEDFQVVSRLGRIAAELKVLEERQRSLLASVAGGSQGAEPVIPTQVPTSPRIARARSSLWIEVTFPGHQSIRISERKSSDTMVVLMERILANMGVSALEKLKSFRTGRGPLISDNPDADYMIPGQDRLYSNHPVPGTHYFVLTHSDNREKVERTIPGALEHLGLPAYSYKVGLD